MNLAAIFKPSLQLLPPATKNLCRNIVNWTQCNASSKHTLLGQFCGTSKPMYNANITLVPNPISVIPSSGMKTKGLLKLYCSDCYFVRKGIRLFVYCDSHPRHKQMSQLKPKKCYWLLSHACMSKKRPY